MNFVRVIALSAALAVTGTTVSFAQKPAHDPRSLSGLHSENIPLYPSIQDFLRKNPNSNLRSQAVTIGQAKIERNNVAETMWLRRDANSAAPAQVRVVRAANGTASWLTGDMGKVATYFTKAKDARLASFSTPQVQAAYGLLSSLAATLGVKSPTTELQVLSDVQDELGYQHTRFQQTRNGVPVWGRDLYVHSNSAGVFYSLNATIEPSSERIVGTKSLAESQAIDHAIADLKQRGHWAPLPASTSNWLKMDGPSAKLVYYPAADHQLHLAYEVSLHANLLESYRYFIDAESGAVLHRIAEHCSLIPETAAVVKVGAHIPTIAGPASGIQQAAGFADASGVDLNGVTSAFRAYRDGAGTYYSIWDLTNFNNSASKLPDDPSGGGLTLTAGNKDLDQNVQLSQVTSSNNTWTDRSAVSAHVNMKAAFDYYNGTFSRKAIDGKDATIISVVHVAQNNQPMDNAYWNGRLMAYGDGDQAFTPLAGGRDVAGHEMTHGVISSTADLLYENQSGALNESFADVFGIMIDPSNFTVGESIMKAGQGTCLRDISDPHNTAGLSHQPAHMSEYENLSLDQDNGGVHTNSGIPNKACYLIIQALGRPKTQQIYYRALTNYLTRNSQFADCRKALEQAATDLYPDAGTAVAAVDNAFDAVGIGGSGGYNGGGNDVPPPTGGTSYIAYIDGSGNISALDVATQHFGSFQGAQARVSTVNGNPDRAQISVPRDGSAIFYVDQSGHLSYVETASGQIKTFPNLNIQSDGDIWNASIAPDGNYITLVSSYAKDPNLYVFNGAALGKVELKPSSTQNGITDNTIQYPDVVSWSPNMTQPKVAFDAYNEITVGTDINSFWSMYEIDVASSKVLSLIPAQPADISAGNITYSNTDPDVIAYNIIDANGTYDTWVSNFATGQDFDLAIPSFTIGGSSVADADRPSFSPDDNYLVMSSPSNKALLVYDPSSTTQPLSSLTFGSAVYNPKWFLVGGVTGITASDSRAAGVSLNEVSPNPSQSSARIDFALRTAGIVRLEVLNPLGKVVATLADGEMEAGAHHMILDEQGLAAGMYMVRLQAAGAVIARKLVHVR